jgi:hypothetical protein
VAPIAATHYIHQQLESRKKQTAAVTVTPRNNMKSQTIDRKSQPLRLIENTLAMKNKDKKKRKATPMEQPQPKRQSSLRTRHILTMHGSSTISSFAVAVPGNGQFYTKEETVRILSALPTKQQRKSLIDDWVRVWKNPLSKKEYI